LGKSGTGRIIFNGNSGTIASANWFTGEPEINETTGEITYPSRGIIGYNEEGTYGIISPSNAGMCIDLDQGWIDAYNFKLTSKNIYLNSDPSYDHSGVMDSNDVYKNYYLRIGEENKTGFIGLDTDGKLDIRVNSLYITSNMGNENLLK
jgi:hypothetical protein